MGKSTLNTARATSAEAELEKALELNARAENLVAECSDELAAVNALLQEEITSPVATTGVADALEKSEVVEAKVNEVSEHLALVNEALAIQHVNRNALEAQLQEAAVLREEARRDAFHDALTGLPNRALLIDRLDVELAHAVRRPWTIAVMFIDLNKFKAVNDQYGHDAGDWVLREVAGRLLGKVRKNDTICRYGGDEFVYLVSDFGDNGNLGAIADDVFRLMKEPIDLSSLGHAVKVTLGASIGIAVFPADGTTASILIAQADSAMYQAKRSAAAYCFASPESS